MTIRDDVVLAPEVEDDPSGYIDSLIVQAEGIIQAYTKNEDWPDEEEDATLDAACVRLTLYLYRLAGAEGAQQVMIGDIQRSNFDGKLPAEIRSILDSKRRVGWI
jgi:hypothetical protein